MRSAEYPPEQRYGLGLDAMFQRGWALRLKTGVRQDAAIRLYMRVRLRRCPASGAYAAMAPTAALQQAGSEIRSGAMRGRPLQQQGAASGPSEPEA